MVTAEKLLVLKAFFLGRAINSKKNICSIALEMIDAAINFHESKTDKKSKRRYLFYILLKSEVLGSTEESIELRKLALQLSQEIDEFALVFKDYMSVKEKIESIPMSQDMAVGDIEYFTKAVLKALNLKYEIGGREYKFLYKVSLRELLEKHNVPYSFSATSTNK